jgi:hypothetical protein
MAIILLKIEVEFEVHHFEDNSNLSNNDLAQVVYDLVEDERNELVTEAKIAALKLLAGDTKEQILMERAEDELILNKIKNRN